MGSDDANDSPEHSPERRNLLAAAVAISLVAQSGRSSAQSASSGSSGTTTTVDITKLPSPISSPTLKQAFAYMEYGDAQSTLHGSLPTISEPIDVGADELLKEYKNATLTLPAQQVEYLLRTLSEHVENCLEIRRQAQDLESQAVTTKLAMSLEAQVLGIAAAQVDFNASNMGRVLANKIDPTFAASTGAVQNAPGSDLYYAAVHEIEKAYVTARKNGLLAKKKYYEESGNGANVVGRFTFLKRLFTLELSEAYQRARAVSAGLATFYSIKHVIPDLKKIGYLDELTIWTRTAVYLLERARLKRDESTVVLPIVKTAALDIGAIAKLDFDKQRGAGLIRFELNAAHFSRSTVQAKNPRLLGLDVAFSGTDRSNSAAFGASSVRVRLPAQKIANPGGTEETKYEPTISISPVDFLAREQRDVRSNSAIHNASPIGFWEIEIEKANSAGVPLASDKNMDNVILLMKLSHDRA